MPPREQPRFPRGAESHDPTPVESSRVARGPDDRPPVPRRQWFGRIADVDTVVAVVAAALYLVLSIVLLPAREYPRALGSGVAVFALAAGAAWRQGRGHVRGRSVLGVGFASMAVLMIPTVGSTHPAAGPLGFLGVQAAMLLWAARRWAPRWAPETRTSLRSAWTAGAFAAGILCALAAIPLLLEFFVGKVERTRILLFYPGYFVGVLAAATVYWLLQRIAHLAVGRHLIGMLGGACVYVATAPVGFVSGEPFDLAAFGVGAAIAGGIIGPAIAFALANKPVARHLTEAPRGTPVESPSS
jgi:hypothetical protein